MAQADWEGSNSRWYVCYRLDLRVYREIHPLDSSKESSKSVAEVANANALQL